MAQRGHGHDEGKGCSSFPTRDGEHDLASDAPFGGAFLRPASIGERV
jgi:hypothetical protein